MLRDSSWGWEEARPLKPGARRAGGTERVPLILPPNLADEMMCFASETVLTWGIRMILAPASRA